MPMILKAQGSGCWYNRWQNWALGLFRMKELGPERMSMGNVKLGVSVNLWVVVPKTASNQSSILSFQIKARKTWVWIYASESVLIWGCGGDRVWPGRSRHSELNGLCLLHTHRAHVPRRTRELTWFVRPVPDEQPLLRVPRQPRPEYEWSGVCVGGGYSSYHQPGQAFLQESDYGFALRNAHLQNTSVRWGRPLSQNVFRSRLEVM